VVEAISLPIVAIGGITTANAPLVMKAGAHGIAVISAVCCQNDPTEAARSFQGTIRCLVEADGHG
jgi:thiamine-phosphate pyrophosphorylase